jgi:hypothetical protein
MEQHDDPEHEAEQRDEHAEAEHHDLRRAHGSSSTPLRADSS